MGTEKTFQAAMKIGILTQPLHRNFGGILQNWALQQVLVHMGHKPEMIFLCGNSRPHGKLLAMRYMSFAKCVIKRYLLGCRDVYLHSILNPEYNPTLPQYADAEFVAHIHKTKRLTADMDVAKYIASRGYDAFVVGSDQVWREDYSPYIPHYFLDFLRSDDRRPRIAYAASFGKAKNYISEERMPICRKLLHRFDAVSVREYEGLDILSRDFDYHEGVKVLDPTLLISADDYKGLIKDKDYAHKAYVAAYILDSSKDKTAILAEVSSHLNLPIQSLLEDPHGAKMLTVSQWLAAFDSADFVVTDSFHGCVFSIIFHKPFIAIANEFRGLDRFISLLRDAGLEKRLVFSSEEFEMRKDSLFTVPDYTAVERRLSESRSVSLDFLADALQMNNNE